VSDTTIGWIILFGSICVASVGLGLRYQFRKQYRWPQVPAVIIESTVRLNGEAFDAVVRFEYSWQGRRFTADTLRSGTISFNWRGPADRLRARFPVGAKVTAYVNDRNPRSAVLEPGGDKWMLPFALSIAAFTAACAIVIIRIGR
jgi:hypothetical protein